MRYDIADTLRKRDAQVVLDIDAPAPIGTDVEFAGNVTGQITLRNAGRLIAAWGHLKAVAVMQCSRCLAEHEVPLRFDFSETCALAQIDEPLSYTRVAEEDEPAPIPILDGDTVDLSELVRQLLVLHLPARSLCRPDCKGLCPQCGANLNEGPCGCEHEEVDARLAPLRELLE
ncbi:MAG: YceD family protein [Armatimonadota bacterium]